MLSRAGKLLHEEATGLHPRIMALGLAASMLPRGPAAAASHDRARQLPAPNLVLERPDRDGSEDADERHHEHQLAERDALLNAFHVILLMSV